MKFAPFAIGAFAFIVSWACFGRTDMSLDEGYTISETKLTFSHLLQVFRGRELNGSLHTVLIWVLTRLPGGDHLTTIRVFSALCAVAAFILFFPVLRRFVSFWPSIAGLMFLAANPLVMQEMTDGRTYALTTLFVVISIRLLLDATDQESRPLFLAWGITSGLMLYGHFLTGPIVLAQVIWLLLAHRRAWKTWLPGVLVTSVMAVPIALFLASAGGNQNQLPPSPPKSLHDYVSCVLSLIAGGADGQRAVQLVAVVLVAICLVLALRSRHASIATLGLLVTALPILFAAVAARSSPSIFQPHYLILALPGLALVVATGVHTEPGPIRHERPTRRAGWVGLLLIIVTLTASGASGERSARQPSATRHSWSAAVALIDKDSGKGDLVTTMVPFEGNVARLYVTADKLSFAPAFPHTAHEFLVQSTYSDRTCPPDEPAAGSLWVMSAMSPHFDADLAKLATCGGFGIRSETHVGYVTVARLARH